MKVRNRVFVLTGGGNGIGRALALNLISNGARIAAVDIDQDGLDETVERAGANRSRLSTHVVDITDRAAVADLPEHIASTHGAVDGLINNAGIIQPFVRVNDLDYDAIERVMNVNFYGTLYMTKEFLPHLLKRPEAHIANVSSMGGFLPVPGQTVYGASKAAVKLFTEGLYSELMDTSVGVTLVLPGAIGTDIAAHSGVTPTSADGEGRASMKPLEVGKAAQIIVGAIEKERYRVRVGRDSTLMDVIYRISPKFAAKFIFKQMKSLLPG